MISLGVGMVQSRSTILHDVREAAAHEQSPLFTFGTGMDCYDNSEDVGGIDQTFLLDNGSGWRSG